MELSQWLVLVDAIIMLVVIALIIKANIPGDKSTSCEQYYAGMKNPPASAQAWCSEGHHFLWQSTLPENTTYPPLNIFYTCQGNPQNPAILLIHGYPTSSYDFAKLVDQLKDNYYLCALDTPGYGFSDKPKGNYHYSIFDDAKLVDNFIQNVAKLKEFTLITHDKGDSVGLALLQIYQSYAIKPYTINHHIITNGNIYLPLAQLRTGQKLLLNPITGPILASLLDGKQLTNIMAGNTYAPALPVDERSALASIFDYQSGVRVEHNIIQYLNERKVNEVTWLETLGKSDIPTTLIWGAKDGIAPVAVPDYVWANYLQNQTTPATYWQIPCANHYLQVDQPALLAMLINALIDPTTSILEIASADCQPVKIK